MRYSFEYLTELDSRKALEYAERVADGACVPTFPNTICEKAWQAYARLHGAQASNLAVDLAREAAILPSSVASLNAEYAIGNLSLYYKPGVLASLLRDTLGNPFQPPRYREACLVCDGKGSWLGSSPCIRCEGRGWSYQLGFKDSWVTREAKSFALRIYKERDFFSLPILGDALEEAGCDEDALLRHLRDMSPSGGHARGCWALDLVLGKI